jgi:hypothetical protein
VLLAAASNAGRADRRWGKIEMADDDDMIGDATPDVEVEEEEVAAEVPTSFATKGRGWSGRDDRDM